MTVNDAYLHIWITEGYHIVLYINIILIAADGSDNKILASTYFFPGNFTKANLPSAKIKVSNVTSVSSNEVSVSS